MERSKPISKSDDFFESLVSNGIDFLKASVRELPQRAKYSVINFYAGLEIFLKARLIREHWSLIVIKPEIASLDKFRRGDFQSVNLEMAFDRLRQIAGEKLGKEEENCFDQVRKHRNRLVHFFHPAHSGRPNAVLVQQIVLEQCKAWFYLHRLLTTQWKEHFKKYGKKIESLNKLMHKQRSFLQAKFSALRPEIEADRRNGVQYKNCSFCGYKSARIDEELEPMLRANCRVCEATLSGLYTPCPDCNETIEIGFGDPGEGTCPNEECETEIDLAYLLEKYGPSEDPKEESDVLYCSSCEHYEPCAIPFNEGHLCLSCGVTHQEKSRCGWCDNRIGGFDPEGSSAFGCFMCRHSIPWDRR